MTTRPRKIDEANQIVLKTLEIIEYLNPTYFVLENPQTGLLKEQTFMYGIPYKDIDYCKYGMPYRKRTRLWNNVFQWNPKPLCKKDCGNVIGGSHIATAQRGPSKSAPNSHFTQNALYSIPEDLIYEIFNSIPIPMTN